MIGTIRRIARLAIAARAIERAEAASQWTAGDAANLSAFMRTDTGEKLIATLRSLTFTEGHAAVRAQPEMLPWSCGHAAGMQTLCGHIDLLARLDAKQDKKRSGPTDDLTWLHGNAEQT